MQQMLHIGTSNYNGVVFLDFNGFFVTRYKRLEPL